MNSKMVEDIASAVLYEGYLLYPYRASSIKNRQRWNFGVLYPRAYAEKQTGADAWRSQTECLVRVDDDVKLSVRARFLHLVSGDGRARERDIALNSLRLPEVVSHAGVLEIKQPAEARIEVQAEMLEGKLFKVRVNIINTADFSGTTRDEALAQSLLSTHAILAIEGGEFVSLLEPPEELRDLAASCNNIGTWPVLVGEAGKRDAMLSSPIILYDYPQIAPESPGALFDGTEIDEILTLRIMTLTDEEKREMALTDDRAQQILERTEAMAPEQFMKMHGVLRNLRSLHEEAP